MTLAHWTEPQPLAERCLRLGLTYLAAALLSIWISRLPGTVAGMWLPTVLTVLMLASRPVAEWPALLATASLSNVSAGLIYGDAPVTAVLLSLINGAEALLGAWAVRVWAPLHPGARLSLQHSWRVAAAGVLLPGLLGAALSALWIAPRLGLSGPTMAFVWYSSASFGGLSLLGPALVWLVLPRSATEAVRHWGAALLLGLAAVVAAGLLSMLAIRLAPQPFVYVGALALVLAVALPLRTAMTGIFCCTCVLVWGAAGSALFPNRQAEDLAVAYLTHLMAVVPGMWVALERRTWDNARLEAEAILAASPSGVLVTSGQGRVLRVNARAAALLGRSESSLLGQKWTDLRHSTAPSQPPGWTGTSEPAVHELPLLRGDGGALDAEVQVTPFKNPEGEAQQLVSITDVSPLRRQERKLREALERLHLFSAATPGVLSIFRMGPDGQMSVPWQSDRAEDFWGLPPDTLAADAAPLFARLPAEQAVRVQANIRVSAATLGLFQEEFQLLLPDGGVRWVAVNSKPRREADGAVQWFGWCVDVTARRAQEAEQNEQRREWALAADAGGVGIWQADFAKGLLQANERWFRLFGRDMPAQPWPVQKAAALMHPDDLHRLTRASAWDGVAEGETAPGQLIRMRHQAGHWIWVEARTRLVQRDAQTQQVLRLSGTMIDVTQRIEAERVQAASEQAQAASLAKTRFVSRMSHELRTPLNAVLGFAELLEEDLGRTLTPLQHGQVKQVIRAAEHLLSLTDDLLDLSSIESDDMALTLQPVAVRQLVDETTAAMMPFARRQGIDLQPLHSSSDWLVMADPRRLKQVLLNLVSNGIKYNVDGGSVRFSIECRPNGEQPPRLHITVTDTGRGIAPEMIKNLGQAFNRLGAERSGIQGSGIGLTICKHLIDRMGGQLLVASTPGQGSSFSVVLDVSG